MSIEIKVPALGESITEATVAEWLVQPGEAVQEDEPVISLETDKVTVEVPAPSSGVLVELKAKQGDVVQTGAVLGSIAPGEGKPASGKPASGEPALTPREEKTPPAPAGEKPSFEPTTAVKNSPQQSPILSPAARRLVEEKGLQVDDIAAMRGASRVTKQDILDYLKQSSPAKKTAAKSAASPKKSTKSYKTFDGKSTKVAMTPLRKTIARRLKEAQNTAAMLTTFNEINMYEVMKLRASYGGDFEAKYGRRLGLMGFFVQACVRGLESYPALNASVVGEDIVYHGDVNMGVAVGTPKGLVVPVISRVQTMDLVEIEQSIAALAGKARDGKISMDELQGGTFTISNGGVYGSLLSTPILNGQQSGILGMHKIEKRAVVIEEDIFIRPMMYVALSYDHRIVDGEQAVKFLTTVKDCIESPQRMLLEV